MCHRYFLKASDLQAIAKALGAAFAAEAATRYNIAPASPIPVLRRKDGGAKECVLLRWGLVPGWSNGPSSSSPMANARAETLAEKASFREALSRRRCVVPASGFYEWEQAAAGKQPWLFSRTDEKPLLFAGLWEEWRDQEGRSLESCTLITTTPNPLVARLHDRMPVILSENGGEEWLGSWSGGLASLLRPFPAEAMTAWRVDPWVNSVAHDDERCIRRYEPEQPEPGDQLALF